VFAITVSRLVSRMSQFPCLHKTEDLQNRAKILVDTPTNMSDIMPETLPVDYQTITPLIPRAGVTVRRYRPLTYYVSG
jgi:hypothetical protein